MSLGFIHINSVDAVFPRFCREWTRLRHAAHFMAHFVMPEEAPLITMCLPVDQTVCVHTSTISLILRSTNLTIAFAHVMPTPKAPVINLFHPAFYL